MYIIIDDNALYLPIHLYISQLYICIKYERTYIVVFGDATVILVDIIYHCSKRNYRQHDNVPVRIDTVMDQNCTRLSVKTLMNNIIEATVLNGNFLCTVSTHHNDSNNRYAFRIQTFAISGATCFCNDHQQTCHIATSVWNEFGKSINILYV